jgi:hypothetical protein
MLTYDHLSLLDTARADVERDLAARARVRAARLAAPVPARAGRPRTARLPVGRRLAAFLRHALS